MLSTESICPFYLTLKHPSSNMSFSDVMTLKWDDINQEESAQRGGHAALHAALHDY